MILDVSALLALIDEEPCAGEVDARMTDEMMEARIA